MPANVLPFEEKHDRSSVVDVPGPLHVRVMQSDTNRPVAEITTVSLLDVHLADEVMDPSGAGQSKDGKKGKRGGRDSGGMAKPLVRLKASIVEVVSLDVNCPDRERCLKLECMLL